MVTLQWIISSGVYDRTHFRDLPGATTVLLEDAVRMSFYDMILHWSPSIDICPIDRYLGFPHSDRVHKLTTQLRHNRSARLFELNFGTRFRPYPSATDPTKAAEPKQATRSREGPPRQSHPKVKLSTLSRHDLVAHEDWVVVPT